MPELPKTKTITVEIKVDVRMPDPTTMLHLLYFQSGDVLAVGPVSDLGLCYNILGKARDAIKDHHDALRKASESNIVKPGPGDISRFQH